MSRRAKEYLKTHAWDKFPAKELWIKPNNRFWAFDVRDNNIYSTQGEYTNNQISYVTEVLPSLDVKRELEELIYFMECNNYYCFAIELRD